MKAAFELQLLNMSARISFSYFSCCYMYLLVVVSLFYLCSSNQKFDDDVLCMDGERHALLQFKHGLIDEADRLASWVGEEKDCCRWAGIACDNSTGHIRRINLRALDGHCDSSDYVTYLEYEKASNQRLRGDLSSSLLHLKQLRHLDLSCNDFRTIKVPQLIGSLRNLRYLNLSDSHFFGVIPPQLGNLSELRVLSLRSNRYQVVHDLTSMLSGLRMLHHLDMSRVDLNKAINWLQVINTLSSLTELDLSNYQLSNMHPHVPSLNITSLSLLDLSYNTFIDSFVPRWIFSLTSLVSLNLRDCNFHGPIPSSINSFRNLTSLKLLDVSGNNFMNSSLVLKALSSVGGNLISLEMRYCGVSSSVLDSLHNLTSLRVLYLSQNQLTKALPKFLGDYCNMNHIDLSNNDFSTINLKYFFESFLKCKSSSLESLYIYSSRVSGHLPDKLGQLIHLKQVELSDNHIVGKIPDSIGKLCFLKTLRLASNRISGPIPYSIGRLSSLEELGLSYNQINGSLPDSLGQLSKLESLSFSYNLLTGVVTETHFAKLVSLKYLNGTSNKLTLRPRLANWIPPFQIQFLYLNSWVLEPKFPLWLRVQRDLVELDISNTCICSPVPESFWKAFPNLIYLDMSQNHIQGTLLGIPATLVRLDLSSNKYSGQLSDFSDGGKEMESLNLGNNRLSGVIPECWEKWLHLEFLNLENNNFSGGIPRTLGSLRFLRSLNLHGNKLSGRLPVSLMNLTNLRILQLGRNELAGSIPAWFGTKLHYLAIFDLRSNNFNGSIPKEFCYLQFIRILDLANNNLSGHIPRCFGNFSLLSGKETTYVDVQMIQLFNMSLFDTDSMMMTETEDIYNTFLPLVIKGREDMYSTILPLVKLMDLSSNNLVGQIPSELTSLKALQTLNLSRNQLAGRIPEKIGDMKSLESFDISLNKLSGELPMSLSSMTFLSSFNVSYNSLTGRIPSSTQLQSFDESSFFGNKLCGPPFTEPCAVKSPDTEHQKIDIDDGSHGADWGLIISILFGSVVGFWIIVAPLIVSRTWRIAYFRFLSECGYMVYDVLHKYCFIMFSK